MSGARVNCLLFRQLIVLGQLDVISFISKEIHLHAYVTTQQCMTQISYIIGFKISHTKKNTLLEGTIPLDKNRPGFGWCDSKQHVMALNSQCLPVSNRNLY